MSELRSFVVGDRVFHTTRGEGAVVINDGEAVTVVFDRVFKFGMPCVGIYDQEWFGFAHRYDTCLRNLMEPE